MNYSSSLPKISFDSTIGPVSIVSFFTFYEYDKSQFQTTTITVDNKSTLTELSQQIYKDNNSMWLFMISNSNIDPFKILAENPSLYSDKTKDNVTLGLKDPDAVGITNYINPVGTIVVPYASTGGSPWEYSSVGNFNLDGPFSIIESTDYYTGKMTLKPQKVQTFITTNPNVIEQVLTIQNVDNVYSTDDSVYDTQSKTPDADTAIATSQPDDGILDPGDTLYESASSYLPSPLPAYGNDGATYPVSNYEIIAGANKNIQVLIPSSLSTIFNKLKSIEY